MSRPLSTSTPPQQHYPPTPPMMAETQSAPNFPPPSFMEYTNRKLPQPIQLPPLSIPPQHSPTSEYHRSPTQPLPSIHASQGPHPPPVPRSQPRPYSSQAAPLDKLLSPHPYTPPRSDTNYSPQASPPRSGLDSRPLPPPPAPISRQLHSGYKVEEPRPSHAEQSYASPIEPQRPSYHSYPSPASTYAPNFSQPHSHYRPGIPPPNVSAPPPPISQAAPYHHPPAYSEPAPLPPPPQRIQPATVPTPVAVQEPEGPLNYELRVRQQPIAARACGFGERDRRVIDPPPIIQLVVSNPDSGVVDFDELRYSLNVVHCTLWNADGTGEETALIQPDRRTTRRLMGQLVASPSVAKDEHDSEGCFFCFPDLSCRTHGRYRLRFVLMRIDTKNLRVGGSSPILTEVLSDVFQVYTAKDFPGMRPSSALTRALKLQGCNIQVKKGNEKALARKRISPSSEDDGDDKNGKKRRTD